MKRFPTLLTICKFGAVALFCVSFLNCGSSVCSSFSSIDMDSKVSACKGGTITITANKVDVAKCETAVAKCSADDVAKITEMANCQKDLPNCEKGKEADFIGKMGACGAKIKDVSKECGDALKTAFQ